MSVYQKLQSCRVELQQAKLKKSGVNKFAGFNYFELSDFLPTINVLFEKYKLFSNFSLENDRAVLCISDTEDNTSTVFTSPIAELELKGCNKIQALGGIHTYLKRYLYVNALEIVENDLFDAISGKDENVKSKTTSKPNLKSSNESNEFISMKQKNALKDKIGSVEFCKLMNENGGKLTLEKFNELMGVEQNFHIVE